jgi:hypothetical protein
VNHLALQIGETLLKSVPLAFIAIFSLKMMKSSSASAKSMASTAFFLALALLPVVSALVPKVGVGRASAAQVGRVGLYSLAGGHFSSPVSHSESLWPQIMIGIWVSGVVMCYWNLSRDIGEARRALNPLRASAVPGQDIDWAVSSDSGPFVWGWHRPMVVLPKAAHDWNREYRVAVVTHELAHVSRKDWIRHLAFRAIRGFYWFNPFVLILERVATLESEMACDDAVIAAGADPAHYANALLAVAIQRRPEVPLAIAAYSPSLARRVRALLDPSKDRRKSPRSGLAGALFLVVCTAGLLAPLTVLAKHIPAKATTAHFREQGSTQVDPAIVISTGDRSYRVHFRSFAAEGRNIELFDDGVRTSNNPVPAGLPAVRRIHRPLPQLG